jgi:hypothetical protein
MDGYNNSILLRGSVFGGDSFVELAGINLEINAEIFNNKCHFYFRKIEKQNIFNNLEQTEIDEYFGNNADKMKIVFLKIRH